jgi:hypothetical protein
MCWRLAWSGAEARVWRGGVGEFGRGSNGDEVSGLEMYLTVSNGLDEWLLFDASPLCSLRLICQQGRVIGSTSDKWMSGQDNTAFGIREVVFGSDTGGSL